MRSPYLAPPKQPLGPVSFGGAKGREPDPGRSRAVRILIAEDDYFVGVESENLLSEAGYAVAGVAVSASEAVEMAGRTRPDLVLMDIRLAENTDGIAAAAEIRSRFGIPSLFVTAHSDPETMARGSGARPAGWISKPYGPGELLRAVAAALASLN